MINNIFESAPIIESLESRECFSVAPTALVTPLPTAPKTALVMDGSVKFAADPTGKVREVRYGVEPEDRTSGIIAILIGL